MLDIKIVNGLIVDGTGAKGFRADVGITGDRITEIGDLSGVEAKETLDVKGQVVCPGFVDGHTHSDMSLLYNHLSSSRIYDGVTTEVIGNCGIGVAPIRDEKKAELIKYLGTRLIGAIPVKLELPWNTMEEYLETVEKASPAVNVVPLVAQGAVRINEMGFEKGHPSPEQLARMRAEVKKAMEAGCAGISSGLMYMPGEYSDVEELAALSQEVAPYDSFYVSHIRSEGDYIFEALDEAIAIAEKGGTALHVSHLKLAGANVWGRAQEVFDKFDAAKAKGLDLTFDLYPYAKACTSLGSCMPPWTFEGGTDNMLERVKVPENQKRIIQEIKEGIPGWQNPIKTAGDWSRLVIATCYTEEGKWMLGRSIAELSQEVSKDPFTFVFDTLIQERGRVQVLCAVMDQHDIDTFISHPEAMIISDSMSLSTEGILSAGNPHPRAFGTHGYVLADYVRKRGVLTLEDAVRKMTMLPARRMRLVERGVLQKGWFADITIFDPETIQDMATYTNPKQYTRGISTDLVNGQFAMRDGKQTEMTSGRVLRKKVK